MIKQRTGSKHHNTGHGITASGESVINDPARQHAPTSPGGTDSLPYQAVVAIASTSMSTPFGSSATPTALRAGGSPSKNVR